MSKEFDAQMKKLMKQSKIEADKRETQLKLNEESNKTSVETKRLIAYSLLGHIATEKFKL